MTVIDPELIKNISGINDNIRQYKLQEIKQRNSSRRRANKDKELGMEDEENESVEEKPKQKRASRGTRSSGRRFLLHDKVSVETDKSIFYHNPLGLTMYNFLNQLGRNGMTFGTFFDILEENGIKRQTVKNRLYHLLELGEVSYPKFLEMVECFGYAISINIIDDQSEIFIQDGELLEEEEVGDQPADEEDEEKVIQQNIKDWSNIIDGTSTIEKD